MMYTLRKYFLGVCLALLLAASGCSSNPTPQPSEAPATRNASPTAEEVPSATPPAAPLASPTPTLPEPTPTAPEPATPTLAPPPTFPFQVPIPEGFRTTVDGTYRFATSQGGRQETHHGVEFLNSFGTPVLAAADGTVLFAGDDNNKSPYSPTGWFAFYGNFIVLEHGVIGEDAQPIYTLYGHLSEILVQEGDRVTAGQEIGRVGFSGAAVGSHLHFEVRVGGTGYNDTRNPEIYLQPHEGRGTLIGSIHDVDNRPFDPIALQVIELATGKVIYFSTYEKRDLAFQAPYFENFALGDLPAGEYELSFMAYALEEHIFEILPGEITEVDIAVSSSGSGE